MDTLTNAALGLAAAVIAIGAVLRRYRHQPSRPRSYKDTAAFRLSETCRGGRFDEIAVRYIVTNAAHSVAGNLGTVRK